MKNVAYVQGCDVLAVETTSALPADLKKKKRRRVIKMNKSPILHYSKVGG
jgi:hypothetical protein